MSRIRRASEMYEIPGYISASFFGEEAEDDLGSNERFASLKQNASSRKASIAQERKAWEEERAASAKRSSWEREVTASQYSDFDDDESDSMTKFLRDFKGNSVRRASYDVDNYDLSYRPNPTDDFDDPLNFFNAGGGIFGDLESAVAEGMDREMQMRKVNAMNRQSEAREEARMAERNKKYRGIQREAQKIVEHQNPLMVNRSSAVFRTAADESIGSAFGMLDHGAVEARERQRIRMAENSRRERLRIRRDGGEEIDTVKDWESNVNLGRSSYQDVDMGWVDYIWNNNGSE